MKLKVIILISIVILVLMRILQYYSYYRNIVNNQKISVNLTIKEYPKTCWFSTEGFVFQIENCDQYPIGTKLQLFGKHNGVIANSNSETILLEIEHIFVTNSKNNPIVFSTQKAQAVLFCLRLEIYSELSEFLPEPMLGLFFSLIFGGNSHLDPETKLIVTQIGVQHLIAASGMQVSLLVELVARMTGSLNKKFRLYLSFGVIVVYLHLAGLSTSVVRAGLMHSLRLLSQSFLQQYSITWSLTMTALVLLLFWPRLFFEAGFQLSFLAVLGIVVSSRSNSGEHSDLQRLESGDLVSAQLKESRSQSWFCLTLEYIKNCLLLTLIVNLWIWPVQWYHFGELNFFGFISGVALIWILLPIFVFGWWLLLGLLIIPTGQLPLVIEYIFLSPVYWLMWLFNWVFNWLAQFNSWSVPLGKWSWQVTLGWYGCLILFLLVKTKILPRR